LEPLGETINIMTLGGMALAVGILVDDATVEIENIHRNMAQGGTMQECILNGAAQIAVPAFVSTGKQGAVPFAHPVTHLQQLRFRSVCPRPQQRAT
jgi:multidrug efflux pump subunit AcrB